MALTTVQNEMLTGPISGGGGAENLITNGTAESASASIFTAYADAAGTRPVDGTGGSPNVTTALNTTNPINGSKDFTLVKDAANRQGQGWATTISIPLAYRAQSLKVSIKTLVTSGTFVAGSNGVDGDVIWYFYDVTNFKLVEPSNIKILSNSTTISDVYEATVQFDYNTASVRLIAHVSTTSTSAYTIQVDDVTLTPQTYVYGTPVSAWQSYTPTYSSVGTVTNSQVYYRRVGDSLQIQGGATIGTVTAAAMFMTIPAGYTIDTSKIASTTYGIFGIGSRVAANSGANYAIGYANSTTVFVGFEASNTIYNSNDNIQFNFTVPIVGLNSTVQMSDQADTRVVAAKSNTAGASGSLGAAFNTTTFSGTISLNTHGAWSGATFTVPVAGNYQVSSILEIVHASVSVGNTIAVAVFKGSTQLESSAIRVSSTSVLTYSPSVSTIVENCIAGDTITVRSFTNGTTPSYANSFTGNSVSISRISGPQAIAVSERLAVSARNAASTAFTSGSFVNIPFATINENTHGWWNGSVFTVGSAGSYGLYAQISPNTGTWVQGRYLILAIYKNGSLYKNTTKYIQYTASQSPESVSVCDLDIPCIAGDTLEIRLGHNNGTSQTCNGIGDENYISIVRNK